MGYNYGKRRNRLEGLPRLRGTVYGSIGEYDINFEKYDWQQTADLVNENQDRAQERYNEKFNFPNTEKKMRRD